MISQLEAQQEKETFQHIWMEKPEFVKSILVDL